MIKIGKLTDYALLITDHLVSSNANLCTNDELSRATKIPIATVRKLLKNLVDADIVSSYRGANGGYRLSRSPDNISIAEVIEAVEGPIALTECALNSNSCNKTSSCNLKTNWLFLNQFFVSTLTNISLADMSQNFSDQIINFKSVSIP